MKVCPECGYVNQDRFPTCIYCNTNISTVPSTTSPQVNPAEHEQHQGIEIRHQITRTKLRNAILLYGISVTFLAIIPGLIFNPLALFGYLVGSVFVGITVTRGITGTFTATLLQCILSTLNIFYLSFSPLFPIMILGHIVLPMLLCLWVDMICDVSQ